MTELAVIIPNYNNARFLMGAVQSVFDSRENLSVPVVLAIGDDGSTDNGESLKIIEAIRDQFNGKSYPDNSPYKLHGLRNNDKLIVHLAEKNSGKNPLLNELIPQVEKTGTEFSVILDADDKMTKPMFHECLPFMEYLTHHPKGSHQALISYCDAVIDYRKMKRRVFGEPVLLKYFEQDLKENRGILAFELIQAYHHGLIFSHSLSGAEDPHHALTEMQKKALQRAEEVDRSDETGAWKKASWLRQVSREISKGVSGTDLSLLAQLLYIQAPEAAQTICQNKSNRRSWRRICVEPTPEDAKNLKKYQALAHHVRDNKAYYETNPELKNEVIWLMHQYQLLEERINSKKKDLLNDHRKDAEFLAFARDVRSNPGKYENLAMIYTGSELLSAEGRFLGTGKPRTFNRFDYRDKSFIPQTGITLTKALASRLPYDDTGIDKKTGKRRPRTKWFMFLKLFGGRSEQIIRLTELDAMKDESERQNLRSNNLQDWPKNSLAEIEIDQPWSALYIPKLSFENNDLLEAFIYTMHKGNVSGIGNDLTDKGSNARKKRLLEGNGYIAKGEGSIIAAHKYDLFCDNSYPYRVNGAAEDSTDVDLSNKWQGAGQATATMSSRKTQTNTIPACG